VQSLPITTYVVSLNPIHGDVYSIKHYVIKSCKDMPHYDPKVFYVIHYIHKLLIHHLSIGGYVFNTTFKNISVTTFVAEIGGPISELVFSLGERREEFRMTTTCAIVAYHHLSCVFEPHSWRGVLDKTLCDQVCQ
jgi:hypothetical protein